MKAFLRLFYKENNMIKKRKPSTLVEGFKVLRRKRFLLDVLNP
jgi:hypothetical protein